MHIAQIYLVSVLAIIMTVPLPGHAQCPEPGELPSFLEGKQLRHEAKQPGAAKRRLLRRALQAFTRAHEVSESFATCQALATVLLELSEWDRALAYAQAALEKQDCTRQPDLEARVNEVIEGVHKRSQELVIELEEPASARLELRRVLSQEQRDLGDHTMSLRLARGEYSLVIAADGFVDLHEPIVVTPGEKPIQLQVSLDPKQEAVSDEPLLPEPRPQASALVPALSGAVGGFLCAVLFMAVLT